MGNMGGWDLNTQTPKHPPLDLQPPSNQTSSAFGRRCLVGRPAETPKVGIRRVCVKASRAFGIRRLHTNTDYNVFARRAEVGCGFQGRGGAHPLGPSDPGTGGAPHGLGIARGGGGRRGGEGPANHIELDLGFALCTRSCHAHCKSGTAGMSPRVVLLLDSVTHLLRHELWGAGGCPKDFQALSAKLPAPTPAHPLALYLPCSLGATLSPPPWKTSR